MMIFTQEINFKMNIMKKLFLTICIAFATLFLFGQGTEKSRADLYSQVATDLASGQQIKISVLRQIFDDLIASDYNVTDNNLINAQYSVKTSTWHDVYSGADRYVRFSGDNINWTQPVLILDGTIMDLDTNRIVNVANPIDPLDAANLGTVDSLLEATKTTLELVSITDPATNEATSTAIIDTSQGVLITLTATGNDQTLQQPTITTAGREFHVLSSSASTGNININGYVMEPGEYNTFTYDGTEWVGNNILSQFTLNLGATGLYEGGLLSGTGTSVFSISDGDGVIVDNTTNHEKPDIDRISWTGLTGITVTNIATAERTYVGITRSGGVPTVVQQTAPFTASQYRSTIVIGSLGHIDHTTVTSVSNTPIVAFDRVLLSSDMASQIGTIVTGNNYAGINASLTVAKSSGNTFRQGANYITDLTTPNITTDASISIVTFVYVYRDGSGGLSFGSPTTTIDVNQYDDGTGTLATVPSNKYTNQRFFFFAGSNLTFILYGQNIYQSLDEATSDAAKETVEIPADIIEGSSLRSILALKKGTIQFTDPITDGANYDFIPIGKFGEITSGATASATTLQQAYNNSVQPQIIIDAGRGAMQFQGGTGTDTDNIFEGLNNAGGTTFELDGNGNMDIDGILTVTNELIVNNASNNPNLYLNTSGTGKLASFNLSFAEKAFVANDGAINTVSNIIAGGTATYAQGTLNTHGALRSDILDGGEDINGLTLSYNGTDINTNTALSNVAYLDRSQEFTGINSFSANIGTNTGSLNYVFGDLPLFATGNNNFITKGNASAATTINSSFLVGTGSLNSATSVNYSNVSGNNNYKDVTGTASYNFGNGYRNFYLLTGSSSNFVSGYLNFPILTGTSSNNTVIAYNSYNLVTSSLGVNVAIGETLFANASDTGMKYTTGIGRNVLNNTTSSDLDYSIGIGDGAGASTSFNNPAIFGKDGQPTANKQVVIGSSFYTGGILLDKDVNITGNLDVSANVNADVYITPEQSLSGTTPTMDIKSGSVATLTLTGNTTLTITNLPTGSMDGRIVVTQDASTAYTLDINGSTGYTTEEIYGVESVVDPTLSNKTTVVFWRTGSILGYGFLYKN